MNTQTRLQKASHIVVAFCNILTAFLGVGALGTVAGMVGVLLFKPGARTPFLGFVNFYLDGVAAEELVFSAPLLLAGLCLTLVLLGLYAAEVQAVRQMFVSTGEVQTPFTLANCERLKRVAYCIAVATFVNPLAEAVMQVAFTTGSTTAQIGLDTLFIAFLVYAVSLVFEHGTALQQQADETL